MRTLVRWWCTLTGAVILTAPVLHVQGQGLRTITIDERLATASGLVLGDSVRLAPMASAPTGQWVRIGAITRRSADPSEIARSEYRVRLHLDQLQGLTGVGDRIGRFAMQTQQGAGAPRGAVTRAAGPDSVSAAINAMAFGFRAYPATEVAIETSATFRVVNRFHRAIGIITIVASAIFLLCITLLKVDERRREVGALRLLGLSRATVVRSVMLEASLIALLGSALGAGFGAAASAIVNWYYQGVYATPLKFALVTPAIVAIAVTLSLLLGIVSGYLAAQRLVRTAPLELVGR